MTMEKFGWFDEGGKQQGAGVERELQSLRDTLIEAAPDLALVRYATARAAVEHALAAIGNGLAASSPTLPEREKAARHWIAAQHRNLARIGRRLALSLARKVGPEDARVARVVALSLYDLGESVKGDATKETHHHGSLHALMRLAIAGGHQRTEVSIELRDATVTCSAEFLYFRALLLARLAGGLDAVQTEIYDAWMWMWKSLLRAAESVPEGATWRGDLDSNAGLRAGARASEGPSLYLSLAPLDDAFRAMVREFHAGRRVPPYGPTSRLPIEDHVAVVDLVRRGLRQARRKPVSRAPRHATRAVVGVDVGLAEIIERGFGANGDPALRAMQMVNMSDTGFALEGPAADCERILPGELVALHLGDGALREVCKVVRCTAIGDGARVTIGVRRLSREAQRVVARRSAQADGARKLALLYVPGNDNSGCHDAYLTTEARAAEREPFETTTGDGTFTLRFNRVRERGRGWVLAGFEVVKAGDAGAALTP